MNGSPVINPPQPHRFRFKTEYLITAILLIVTAIIMIACFERIPLEGNTLAIDWRGLYPNLKNGQVVYDGNSIKMPPWSVPALLPLGFLPLKASWALLTMATLIVLAISVPRRQRHLLAMILLLTSWPAIRQVVDGNFEFVVISGLLLIIYGFERKHLVATTVGLLLATAKPQEVWLLMIVLGTYFLRAWSLQRIFELAMSLAVIVVPAVLLFGRVWIAAMSTMVPPPGSILDMSLMACLNRLGIASPISTAIWLVFMLITLYVTLLAKPTLSRAKVAMLIAASLLLGPYAAGNSYLTILTIGIIPLFQSRPRLGLALILLADAGAILQFAARDFLYWNGAYYTMLMVVFIWAYWIRQIYKTETSQNSINKLLLSKINN